MAIKRIFFKMADSEYKAFDLSQYRKLLSMKITATLELPNGYSTDCALGFYFQSLFVNGDELMQTDPCYLNVNYPQIKYEFEFDKETLSELAIYHSDGVGSQNVSISYHIELKMEDFVYRRK